MTPRPDEQQLTDIRETSLEIIERIGRKEGATRVKFRFGEAPNPEGEIIEVIGQDDGRCIVYAVPENANDKKLQAVGMVRAVLRKRYENNDGDDWIQPQ